MNDELETGPRTLIDAIEHFGALAETGELPVGAAAHRLQQFSDGGLTLLGAQNALSGWRTVRRDYSVIFDQANRRLHEWKDRP